MPSVEQIRRVVTQYVSEGADKSAADLNNVASAQNKVAQSNEVLSTTTDSLARRQLSAAGAWDRLLVKVDAGHRAQREFEKGVRVADAALRQGITDAEGYARALDLIKAKSNIPLAPPIANDNLKLASHEVSNLSMQMNDMATMLASGASPFQVIATQGGQISQIMGDRGLKGMAVGVGQAFMSLLTPVNMVLLGVTALGLAGMAAYQHIWGSTEDTNEALERHNKLQKQIEDQYGGMTQAAVEYARRSEQGLLADVRADAQKQKDELRAASGDLAGQFATSRIRGLGEVYVNNSNYAAFAEPIKEFLATVAAGEPQVERLRERVAELMNEAGDPAIEKAGAEIRAAATNAADAEGRWRAASGALDMMQQSADGVALSVKGLVDETMRWLANDKLTAELEKVAELDRRLAAIGDPRERAVQRSLARFDGDATPDQMERARKAAEATYDASKRLEEQQRAQADATRESQREQREMERDAQRVYQSTRTAVEQYNDQLRELNELLAAGAISQETFGRASAKAASSMAEAQEAARMDALGKSQNPFDGLELASTRYFDSVGTQAEQVSDLMLGMFGSMEDGFANFVKTGKLDFDSLVDSMIDGLARYTAQQMMLSLIGGFGGPAGATAGAGGGGGLGGGGGIGGLLIGLVGSLFGFADGGHVKGPGTGKSDSILARLSNGEFVVNAKAASQHGSLLESINSGRFGSPAYAVGTAGECQPGRRYKVRAV